MADGAPHLVDTNILLRLSRRDDPDYSVVRAAVETLQRDGTELCYTPQNVIEFWNVATRPKDRNGFGLSIEEADHEAHLIQSQLTLLSDNDQIFPVWRSLVVTHAVSGVQVHDARLVAAMKLTELPIS